MQHYFLCNPISSRFIATYSASYFLVRNGLQAMILIVMETVNPVNGAEDKSTL